MRKAPTRAEPMPFDDRVRFASNLAVLARANLDIFAFLHGQANLDTFEAALSGRAAFFDFTRTAHEHTFLARIANLFSPDPPTINFPKLVKEGGSKGAINASTCATIEAQIKAAQPAYTVVKRIRNTIVGHQNKAHRKPDIYAQERPTIETFIELSNRSLEIAGSLCSARGITAQAVTTLPVSQLSQMLTDLHYAALGE